MDEGLLSPGLFLGTAFLSAAHSKTSDMVLLFYTISEVCTNFGMVSSPQTNKIVIML